MYKFNFLQKAQINIYTLKNTTEDFIQSTISHCIQYPHVLNKTVYLLFGPKTELCVHKVE